MKGLTRRQMFKAMAVTAGAVTLGTTTAHIAGAAPGTEIRVLSINTWLNGTGVSGGLQMVADVITATRANVVLLLESNSSATNSIANRLTNAGTKFYATSTSDTGILSQFPISESSSLNSMTKTVITVDSTQIATYAAHLNYKYYATYLPRGYGAGNDSGEFSQYGFKKMPAPVTDVEKIQLNNMNSGRPEAITNFINDAALEQAKGRSIILGGDFNEPSHLDWTDAAKNLFDHNGVVLPWETTRRLEAAGFLDAYRSQYPDPVTHPGFTWPSDNPAKPTSQLTWAPDADERDRIDYIFTDSTSKLSLTETGVVGPRSTIVRNQRVAETSQDNFIASPTPWPTDHKAVLAVYQLGTVNTTTAMTSPGSAFAGQNVNLHAKVSPAVRGGSVEFTIDGGASVTGTVGTDGVAVASYTFTTAGAHNVVARYSGATGAESSVAPAFPVNVTTSSPTDARTTTTLDPVGTIAKDAAATLKATVDPATAIGAIQFKLGDTPLSGPVTVLNGIATLATMFAASGTFSVTAEFVGGNGFIDSASAPQTLTVPGDPDPGNSGGSVGNVGSLFGNIFGS
ncbi:Ig-like domain repeat protein [Rhodococcus sp. OK302]|uniref:Ig-like domain repeat protein n=1 Tax=Rhodococcus sp. OK302 TaxID=1882769 RepID=UPI000B9F4FB5|nr:Ig-like domain repeat protein [Rhodococcus sp. OK302]OYD66845.1 endonuclease/exonuclease/phosphatase family protein [Rhodococcus sp. OK302]